jgi:hypothetical protein
LSEILRILRVIAAAPDIRVEWIPIRAAELLQSRSGFRGIPPSLQHERRRTISVREDWLRFAAARRAKPDSGSDEANATVLGSKDLTVHNRLRFK